MAAAVLWLLFMVYTAAAAAAAAVSAVGVGAATWCVVRSDASDKALQPALDYACGAGADCAPIQSSGLCYLPNTLQAHASYAFNSYFQRNRNALGSCEFSGTATIATTDPSYGSCSYPSSQSNAGGTGTPGGGTPAGTNTPRTMPIITEPPSPPGTTTPFYGGSGGIGPVIPDSPTSNAKPHPSVKEIFFCATFLLVFSFIFQTM